jgi:uncharacterized protein
MSLSDIEVRVLGALLEKERTTPEVYPLSTNALILACNQKTNRDPVTAYSVREIEETMRSLETKGLAHSSRGNYERVVKHHHKLAEAFDLSARDAAVLAVLMLRGLQTPGELRSRTERYVHFPDVAAVEESLSRLLEHRPSLVRNYGRGPGQSQDRWGHTLGVDPERQRPRVRQPEPSSAAGAEDGIEALRLEVARLRAEVNRLLEYTGLATAEEEP